MVVYESITLNNGVIMPVLGLGTWKATPGEVGKAVEIALKAGYRHIDTATGYANEREVGEGIKASGVPRDQVFLTTKLDVHDMTPSKVEVALRYSLKQLDTHIDLWLIHWPAPMLKNDPDRSVDWLDTWHELERLYLANKDQVRSIGVSNFTPKYLERLLNNSTVVPAVNQVELHPFCSQTDIVKFCRSKGIALTSYCPLGSNYPPLMTNNIVNRIATEKGISPANVLISLWANQEGISVITKSVNQTRIEANKKLVELTPEEVKELIALDKIHHFRVCTPEETGWGSLGFSDFE